MVDEGADRDEIMIHVGMLLMLEQLDCASDISQAKPHEDGEGSSGDRIQIRPIVEDAAATSLCN